MSASQNRERIWRYAAADPVGDEVVAASYALAPFTTADLACWAAYAPKAGRESTVALRRTAIGRATFTVLAALGFAESDLIRLQRTGTLYTVTTLQPVTLTAEVIMEAETVERGQYAITEDVPAFTAANVIIDPAVVNISPGTVRRLHATVTNAEFVVLADRPVKWLSSNNNVALVDAQGRVEGVSSGVATITATAGDASGEITVTVF